MNYSHSAFELESWDLSEAQLRARQLFQLRRKRSQHFNQQIFSEPAWDVLLLLFGEGLSAMAWTAKAIANATETPPPTMGRWLAIIEGEGLIERTDDSATADTTYSISRAGRSALHVLLSAQ